jgi:hypothetical protein
VASATHAKGRAKVSWQATDAVLHLFDRKDKASEFIMLFRDRASLQRQ